MLVPPCLLCGYYLLLFPQASYASASGRVWEVIGIFNDHVAAADEEAGVSKMSVWSIVGVSAMNTTLARLAQKKEICLME